MTFALVQHGSSTSSSNNKNEVQFESGCLLYKSPLADKDDSQVLRGPILDMYESFVPWLPQQLHSTSTAGEEQKQKQQPQEAEAPRGWLSKLLFGNKRHKTSTENGETMQVETTEEEEEEEDNIEEVDVEEWYRETCPRFFPQEAHSLARFHALSVKAQRHVLNMGRVPTTSAQNGGDDGGMSGFLCASLDVGVLVDFYPQEDTHHDASATSPSMQQQQQPQPQASSSQTTHCVVPTSDRLVLLDMQKQQQQQQQQYQSHQPPPPRLAPAHPAHIRVAAFGRHCRAVSWGFDDGLVFLYRRCHTTPTPTPTPTHCNHNQDQVWVPVACIVPSSPPEDIMFAGANAKHSTTATAAQTSSSMWGFVSGRRCRQGVIPCPSLQRVTDLVPLLVPVPQQQQQPPTESQSHPRQSQAGAQRQYLGLLLVSRLGGSIEVVPLPSNLWCTPTNTTSDHDMTLPLVSDMPPRPMTLSREDSDPHFWLVLHPSQSLDTTTLDAEVVHTRTGETEEEGKVVVVESRVVASGMAPYCASTSATTGTPTSTCMAMAPVVNVWQLNVQFCYHPQLHATGMQAHCQGVHPLLHHHTSHTHEEEDDTMTKRWNQTCAVVTGLPQLQLRQFLSPPPVGGRRGREVGNGGVGMVDPVIYFEAPLVQLKLSFVEERVRLAMVDYYGGVTIIDMSGSASRATEEGGWSQVCGREEMHKSILPHAATTSIHNMGIHSRGGGGVTQLGWVAQGKDILLACVTKEGDLSLVSLSSSLREQVSPKCMMHTQIGGPFVHLLLGQNGSTAISSSSSSSASQQQQVCFVHCTRPSSSSLPFSSFRLCSVQKLDPTRAVAELMRDGFVEQALELAETYNRTGGGGEEDASIAADTNATTETGAVVLVDTDPMHKVLWERAVLQSSVRTRKRARTPSSSSSSSSVDDGLVPLTLTSVERHLCAIHDHAYVAHASLLEYRHVDHPNVLQAVWIEGMQRTVKLLEDEDGLHKHAALKQQLERLQSLVRDVGMYAWLSHRLYPSSDESKRKFRCREFYRKFITCSTLDLAQQCALRGDVLALLAFVVRYPQRLLGHWRMLLECLPPTVDPRAYAHLLPVVVLKEDNGEENVEEVNEQTCHFMAEGLDAPVMVEGLASHFASILPPLPPSLPGLSGDVVDSSVQEDPEMSRPIEENAIMGNGKHEEIAGGRSKHDQVMELAQWYLQRALWMESEGCSVEYALFMCDLGLERLGSSLSVLLDASSATVSADVSSPVADLVSLRATLHHFSKCLLDGIVSPTMSLAEWDSMDVETWLAQVLGVDVDALTLFSRWKKYVQPTYKAEVSKGGPGTNVGYGTLLSVPREGKYSKWARLVEHNASIENQTEVTGVDFNEKHYNDKVQRAMDEGLVQYTLNRVQAHSSALSSTISRHGYENDNGKQMLTGFSICAVVANASRTSLAKHLRMIHDADLLISMVLDVVYKCASSPTPEEAARAGVFETYLDTLWELYECLPLKLWKRHRGKRESTEEYDEAEETSELDKLQMRVDRFKAHLITTEICSRYIPPLSFAAHLQAEGGSDIVCKHSSASKAVTWTGYDLVHRMTQVFLTRAIREKDSSYKRRRASWKDDALTFTTDLIELKRHVYPQLPTVSVEEQLVHGLIQQQKFSALKDTFEAMSSMYAAGKDAYGGAAGGIVVVEAGNLDSHDGHADSDGLCFMRSDVVENAIIEYLQGQLYSWLAASRTRTSTEIEEFNNDDLELPAAVIECHKIFSPLFIQLDQDLQRANQLINAVHMLRGNLRWPSMTPFMVASLSPVQLIDKLLTEQPEVITSGTEWGQPAYYASRRLELLAVISTSVSSKPGTRTALCLPHVANGGNLALPGKNVLRLSKILGLTSAKDEVLIRRKMVRRSLALQLYGAATALCVGAILEANESLWGLDDVDSLPVVSVMLDSIASVVQSDDYGDFDMRREFCRYGLSYRAKSRRAVLPSSCSESTNWRATSDSLDAFMRYYPILESRGNKPDFSFLSISHQGYDPADTGSSSTPAETSVTVDQQRMAGNSDFLVFKAAGIFAKSAKTIVDQVSQGMSQRDLALRNERLLATSVAAAMSTASDPVMQEIRRAVPEFEELVLNLRLSMLQYVDDGCKSNEFAQTVEANLVVLARRVVLWCVSEAATIRYISKSCGSPDIAKLLELGLGLVVSIKTPSRALSVLKEAQSLMEQELCEAMEVLAQSHGFGNRSNVADESIVSQLCHRGYSTNGARRAALAVGNESFAKALSWAIMHFRDQNFDLPVISVKPVGASNQHAASGEGWVDQQSAQRVRESLKRAEEALTQSTLQSSADSPASNRPITGDPPLSCNNRSLVQEVVDESMVGDQQDKLNGQTSEQSQSASAKSNGSCSAVRETDVDEQSVDNHSPPLLSSSPRQTPTPIPTPKPTQPLPQQQPPPPPSPPSNLLPPPPSIQPQQSSPQPKPQSPPLASYKNDASRASASTHETQEVVTNGNDHCLIPGVEGPVAKGPIAETPARPNGNGNGLCSSEPCIPASKTTASQPASQGLNTTISASVDTNREAPSSAGSYLDLSRDTLLARGRKARTQRQVDFKKLGADERRKLALEGRRLLEEARKARMNGAGSAQLRSPIARTSPSPTAGLSKFGSPHPISAPPSLGNPLTAVNVSTAHSKGDRTESMTHVSASEKVDRKIQEKETQEKPLDDEKEQTDGWGWTDDW